MFIILLSYKCDLTVVDQHLQGHNAYLQKWFNNGTFICSGPQIPRTGGVILCRAESKQSVQSILNEDPFVTQGVANWEIIEFRAADYQDAFREFVE